MRSLPIQFENVYEWFPSPHVENPLAAHEWWQVQSLGLLCAIQLLRLVPQGDCLQQSLIELRRSIDTALLVIPPPPDDEIQRRLAQTLAPFCPSSFEVVEAILDLANVTPEDVLVDLGSGDGRIVLAASKAGCTAVGIEIDPLFVAQAQERIQEDPAYQRASFRHADILAVDFTELQPTVITCYLLTSSMQALSPKFSTLPPGTRIISHAFSLDGWKPVRTRLVDGVPVFLWVI